jgi:hypothetical protein
MNTEFIRRRITAPADGNPQPSYLQRILENTRALAHLLSPDNVAQYIRIPGEGLYQPPNLEEEKCKKKSY